jgi:DNA uptake protein ComE-like DNA-binding protein
MAVWPPTPDPYGRFRSLAEVTAAAQRGERIDVHSATVDDWLRLPGISIHQARSLVALQQAGLTFYAIEDVAAALEVPLHRIQGWAVILRFQYLLPAAQPWQLNANRATPEELQALPALHPDLVAAIISTRAAAPFQDWLDFQQRLGLTGEILGQLLPYLRFRA